MQRLKKSAGPKATVLVRHSFGGEGDTLKGESVTWKLDGEGSTEDRGPTKSIQNNGRQETYFIFIYLFLIAW